MPLKLLLTDSECTLGHAVACLLERENYKLLQPTKDGINWCDAKLVLAYMKENEPDIVINIQGWQPSSTCEQLSKSAINLAAACVKINASLIHLSSHLVFGGNSKSTYTETDEPEPKSAIGKAFLKAEKGVARHLENHINLRFSWIVDYHGDNFLTQLLRQLQTGMPWVLHSRVRGAPTWCSDAARVIVTLVKQISCGAKNWGVMQYCSADACSEVEFAQKLMDVLTLQNNNIAIPELNIIDESPKGVPVSAVLSSRRIRDDFGVQQRAWQARLQSNVEQWFRLQEC